jgi:UDP-2-acetamido-2-deoxy-ribo-hexuluronate aminotransferase
LQAAILRVKLKYLDVFIKGRQKAADYYDEAFKDTKEIIIPERNGYCTHVFHQYTIRLRSLNRDRLREYLESRGIPAMIYYPVPLHRQKAFRTLGLEDRNFPATEELCRTVLSLPMHTELDNEQLEYITTVVKDFINNP